MNITEKLIPTTDNHLSQLFEILKSYPDFFDDTVKIDSIEKFQKLYSNIAVSLTVFKNDEIVGCMWIDNTFDNYGEFNILIKRRSLKNYVTPILMRQAFKCFFNHLNLKMIFGMIRINNFAAINLVSKVKGIMVTEVVKCFEVVGGKPVDCAFVSILRESVI